MDNFQQLNIIILLLIAVLALTTIARRLAIPYPILLVIGGLVLSFIPGLPTIRLDPDLIFLVFLPPLLWAAAYFTSWRDFRANVRPITLLAVGLVIATTVAVASVARAALPELGWTGAIVLGAIVSPPDAVSATAIMKHLRIPRRAVTILEGESLVNDATALVLYRAALAAVVSGKFELSHTFMDFFLVASMGIAVGIVVGIVCCWVLGLTEDSFSEIAITLLAPYIAWVLAEQAHASAVLACVTGGLYIRQRFSAIVAPITRIQARAVWDLLVFILNGIIFILIGLQLDTLREAVPSSRLAQLTIDGILVSATAIAVRLVWIPTAAWVPRLLNSSLRARDPMPSWPNLFILGWSGMRGVVSLAAAMALPFVTADGAPFPFRAEIILIAFMVILVTLVFQGLSLPLLIRLLDLGEDKSIEYEVRQARERAATAALNLLDTIVDEDWPVPGHIEQLRVHYDQRLQRNVATEASDAECTKEITEAFRRLRHETLTAERLAVINLRNEDVISDEVLHRLEHELDVEALRIGIGELRVSPERQHTKKPKTS
ncbi:Na+/H+ antiporter [Candidatus Methylobacter oryzae]|uniref:Na+/H+ antiporter n=1 Tax=Candidatus Methylobacter oryzae TaxID=2497749 RepID=A0ABY3CF66_9GAMM|nr:Na+/H+ antiporter [Candidatus Methylobacter oryzae]TRX02092.1 Na+/H+ antiporter [Candidatus Methylobacter oryzae]